MKGSIYEQLGINGTNEKLFRRWQIEIDIVQILVETALPIFITRGEFFTILGPSEFAFVNQHLAY